MHSDRIDEIRARVERATAGPWRLQVSETHLGDRPTKFYIASEVRAITETRRNDDQARDDAQFIMHSREDVPFLLAEIERLRAEVAALTSCD